MAVKLLQVLVLGVIAAAADDDVPVTWVPSPRASLPCQVPDAERIPTRRPPPPLEGEERTRLKPYQWWRDSEDLKRSSAVLELNRRKDKDKEGVYQCGIRHQGGLVLGYPVNLKFAYLEKQFSVHPANATAWRGQPYVLTCDISSGPPAAVSWLRDGEPLPEDSRYHMLYNELIISEVKDEDAGLYRCRATNAYANKSRTSHGGRLQVDNSPEDLEAAFLPVHHESSMIVAQGSRVVLPCPVTGNPKPVLIWEITPPGKRTGELEATDEMLVMPTIAMDQEGVYVCRVEGHRNLVKVYNVTITVPVNITHPPESKQVVRASTVRFNCTASGSPAPNVTWYKNGQLLELTGRIDVVSFADDKRLLQLLIRSVTSTDAGVYQCFARNAASVQSAWAWLNVTGGQPAAAPRAVTCLPGGARDVTVRWTPGTDEVVAYTVQYTGPDGSSYPGQPVKHSESKVSVRSPLTPYSFQVRAYMRSPTGNKDTASLVSDMSESVTCQGQGVPIKLSKDGDDVIQVSWQGVFEPPEVVQWILQYKAENSSDEHNVTLNGDIYNYTLKASPSKPLQVRVLGTRSLPWLQQNLTLVPWTSSSAAGHYQGPGEVRIVPEDVEVIEVNARNFTVRWHYEEEAVPKTYCFFVCTRRLGGNDDCRESYEKSARVINLQPDSDYEVRVQARLPGQALGGEFSYPIKITTPSEGEQNIRDVTYKYINMTTVRVSWNSELSEYTVRYTSDYVLPLSQWTTVETDDNIVLINGLDPTKKLFVIVDGHETAGHRSVLAVPAQMPEAKDLKYSYIRSGVSVTWKGDGPRVVSYSQNLTQPVTSWRTIKVSQTSVQITGLDPSLPTFVMVAPPGPSSRSEILNINPPPPENSSNIYLGKRNVSLNLPVLGNTPVRAESTKKLYGDVTFSIIGIGIACGVLLLFLLAVAAVCIWRKRKRGRSPIRLRRRYSAPNEAEAEGSEMTNIVGGRLANGGGSKDAGEPLLNGHVHITENPTQSKAPNGKVRIGDRYSGAFDVTRYEDADATLETVLGPDTSLSPYALLDTSRRPERGLPPNDSFNKLPDGNMNSELARSADFQLPNSKVLPTLQPNG